ncbi:bifunctional phosphopantothenoylcysteine decarboxylase/phosphopantothenate--cysteine ligase CoaBC [Terriglobus roseus]|uniref:Coenzyme A biosynthesis bifunctional protein CoaBC n=1 Tax=Terriglobus roseus TaxID=392734 RepID=A0A1G7GWD7_9BACT|nr:bifunctional phosphopantothenoylcysteine decarboxylase/phosphopantothenate--cysteine ligase CoaBC [Terriglobus roseus]SDE92373.1 phosphopantothenoylcysteine decarboxylase / phosphopantothenate--cysteine ligase [Terriglobus roseus]
MKVILGVCGGIAAYKSAELLRELQRRGATVQVAMTENAERFITPLTFAALSGSKVMTSLWQTSHNDNSTGDGEAFDIEHIQVTQDADVLVVAPATANMLAKMAHGFADDFLSAAALAATIPIVVAPAMNRHMWDHPATQANLEMLRQRGVHIVEPGSGELACGMVGAGRLAEPSVIADRVFAVIKRTQDLVGETILITAGGTREPIDPVRFIGNRSSGKMGVALAEAALDRGAKVILVGASMAVPAPPRCESIRVTTAQEMEAAVLKLLSEASIVIMAAAVSDYRVVSPAPEKLKKKASLELTLEPTRDILRQIAEQRQEGTIVVGFAAETENLLEEGRRKLHAKGADLIVANDVSQANSGFESDVNEGVLISRDAEEVVPRSSKREMADRILDWARSAARARTI